MKTRYTKRLTRFPGDTKPPKIKMQRTEIGTTKQGLTVVALTDAAGPQVIVKGTIRKKNIHLLSKPLKNHKEAISFGKAIIKNGHQSHKQWFDLTNAATNMFALFGGMFR